MGVPATLPELLRILYAARGGGVRLELERIRACLRRLGDPQSKYVCVHIGGTNGKGSTAAYLDSILRRAGVRTGLFTSPHLSRFRERFVVDGEPMAEDDLLRAGQVVHAAIAELPEHQLPTFFERITAMALWAFARAGVKVAVLEVGLGGRFDATNVVGAPVAAVTGVSLEHQRYLGEDLESIAREKAGIFRRGQHVVIGTGGEPQGIELLVRAAEAAGVAGCAVVSADTIDPGWTLGIPGPHQRGNAAVAAALASRLAEIGVVSLDGDVVRDGIAAARFPGRLETIAERPEVIVDGAHNPHAVRTLARALDELGISPDVFVLGVSSDKDLAAMAAALLPAGARVVATQSRQPRSLPAGEVAQVIARVRDDAVVEIVPTVAAAVDRAVELAHEGGSVLVTGSLFVVGEARERLCGIEPDALDLSDPV